MDDPGEENLDDTSIKPVSSLRSHFEQMANLKPKTSTAAPPRPISPKPTINAANGDNVGVNSSQGEGVNAMGEGSAARGRERGAVDNGGLRPPRANESGSLSLSPTRNLRPRPVSAFLPSVMIQPPQSPPENKGMNLSLDNTSSYLSTGSPMSATSGTSSPRHFRISSRPSTPRLEPGRSGSLPPPQPPSPPPPRRSGEQKRDHSQRPGPPPVNRAEKPKIGSKPLNLTMTPDSKSLAAPVSNRTYNETSSPFGTPPSSGDSPEHEVPAPALPPNKPRPVSESSQVMVVAAKSFEPPPVHYSVASRRRDQDTNGLGRAYISPQVTGEQKPSLPTRPHVVPERSKARAIPQGGMMPPPQPRASMDRARPINTTNDAVPTFSTPPKRVFSTPTTSLQTPPRSHGRSMTVDRTSSRTPTEFRTPATNLYPDSRSSLDVTSLSSAAPHTKELLTPNLGEYPDSSSSNRRPPCFKQGVREIGTKYDTRIHDVCGEFVCTSGHITRVWSLLDGEIMMSLSHTEGIKIVSVCFKPGADVTEEGARLWLGNNIGELFEVDIATQTIVITKTSAHTRREIIKIYRHKNEMWTLDDGGTLHLWAPDSSGAPALTAPAQSFRVPKGHTFSMVIGDTLWHATGKDIRIFLPTLEGNAQFQVLQRPLYQQNAGDVTSGTVINTQPDRVYFGHVDGKISIYSTRDYSCVGVFNISVYKITSLAAVGGKLWAGFSTGMIYVYDTTQTPWAVKKDWHAHRDPLISMTADRSSFWSLDRAHVVSLGQDNMIRVWDGLLSEDWIETKMQLQEAVFCELKSIRTLVMTWNAGASTPYHLQHSEQDQRFFKNLLQSSESPDILVFGFQELVDLEDKKTTAKSFFKSKKKDPSTEHEHMSHQYRDWRDFLIRCLDDYMPRKELYHLLYTSSLVGLFTCIFVKASLRERIRNLCGAEVKRGLGGLHGNKASKRGALIVRFVLDDTSLCFVNCHLAAGQSQTKDRNADITMILEGQVLPAEHDVSVRQDSYVGGGDGTMIMDHEICVLNGDLNYRIDTMGRDTVVNAIKTNNLAKLLERDQLLASKRKNPWFRLRAFQELPLTFAPTYKYDVGTDNYDTSEKKRAPAWCDRLLYRGRDRVKQLNYQRHEVRVSDHRPVTGLFEMIIKTISPQKRAVRWDECQNKLKEMKEDYGHEARLDYLTNVLGYDSASGKKLIRQKESSR
ncbi:putative inositol polyphosphate 5-phosphatase [Hyphodiscus hymeniophilus]|uniref:Inositol polyphosphate 5-phosphatase n=1 Tax=Hyphodiscus hymeniophilus TaxID=353542 RepID=A0A9P6VEZ8_9HELO|nr:putative inositol polyphosphate 5-phosphatase [Hyphodiscus hymeniophilus]